MERLSGAHILKAWEIGAERGPIDRSLSLLWAGGYSSDGDLADLPIGLRDQYLFDMRAKIFGDNLQCGTSCPNCGEFLELELSNHKLMATLSPPQPENITVRDQEFQLRPLNSRDLVDASNCETIEDATTLLRHRICGRKVDDLPADIISELEFKIEKRETSSEVSLSLSCVKCQHDWSEVFDIGSFFWTELEARARQLLIEISELARAFSWSETEILNLSPRRRKSYLTIARGG